MALRFTTGDIFESGCEALVNPVNCVGVMGAGLAKEFKARFPDYFHSYQQLCDMGLMEMLQPVAWRRFGDGRPDWIVSFPTKRHWKDKSDIIAITIGLGGLLHVMQQARIESIALPALGCGNGGLAWPDVKLAIETFGRYVPRGCDVLVYEPNT